TYSRCRVCLKQSKELVNIFNISQEQGVSIAELLSQSTGLEILKGDSYPETVCPPCLQYAKKAHQRSQQFFQQLKQDPAEMIDLKEEESCAQVKMESIDNSLEESAPQMEYFLIDEFLSEETEEYDQGQVINEPIEDESLEEDFGESLDYEIDPSYLQEQSDIGYGNRPIMKDSNPTSSEFQCSFCPRLFPTKSQQKIHEHRHKGPTYKCPHCQMAFMFKSLLNQHIKKHTNKQNKRKHLKSHPKIPLLKCIHCELLFKSQIELEEHIETHTEETYRCSVENCQRVFHNKIALKNHIEFNHVKKPHRQTNFRSTRDDDAQLKPRRKQCFMCSHCDKFFKSNRSLALHVKNQHS
ncbi:hypothetical protein KR032_004031, partial [Drosophila birchii]